MSTPSRPVPILGLRRPLRAWRPRAAGAAGWRLAGALLVAAAAPVSLRAQTVPPAWDQGPATAPGGPAAGPSEAIGVDRELRPTLPVYVNGKGPFQFIIDTGSDRSSLSRELAAALKLPEGRRVLVHSSGGEDESDTAVVGGLEVSGRTVRGIEAPLFSQAVLGAAGTLGLDALRNQHVEMNLKTKTMSSSASRSTASEPGTIVVRGKSRFGQLILIDAEVQGIPVYVILDTGSESTVGNAALIQALNARQITPDAKTVMISATGRRTAGEAEVIQDVRLGGLSIHNMPVVFAPLHTFARFGLNKQPALILGMDVLSACDRVSIDFGKREASFSLSR